MNEIGLTVQTIDGGKTITSSIFKCSLVGDSTTFYFHMQYGGAILDPYVANVTQRAPHNHSENTDSPTRYGFYYLLNVNFS